MGWLLAGGDGGRRGARVVLNRKMGARGGYWCVPWGIGQGWASYGAGTHLDAISWLLWH